MKKSTKTLKEKKNVSSKLYGEGRRSWWSRQRIVEIEKSNEFRSRE